MVSSQHCATKERFILLVKRNLVPAKIDENATLSLWNDLNTRYRQEFRQYHTLNHVSQCLRIFDGCKGQVKNADHVELAIWYHDAIFTPGHSDNEIKSATHFSTVTKSLLPLLLRENVVELITVTDHKTEPASNAQKYICDIDLSSFALEWSLFFNDCKDLYKEEISIERGDYIDKKVKFFNAMINKKNIYYTDFFRRNYESQARSNIRRILDLFSTEEASFLS